MKVMVDLFSGFGGASEAFMRSREWTVKRFENNPLLSDVENTQTVDLTEVTGEMIGAADLVWASPPCLEFSQAYNAPAVVAKREGREFTPTLDLVKTAIRLIDEIKPTYFVIENVFGAIPHFKPLLGKPRQLVSSFALWGNFPYLIMPQEFHHLKTMNDVHSSNPLRSNYRAIVPYEISEALLKSFEHQQTLF